MRQSNRPDQSKISSEFLTRLRRLQPQQKVRVIVFLQDMFLQDGCPNGPSPIRSSRPNRQAAMQAMRQSTTQALGTIEEIISCFNGRKLADRPTVLGSIPVEITVDGIHALTHADAVKAVVEDQPIYSGVF